MMKAFWINLPVKDVQKSVAFFIALGFKFNPSRNITDHSACLMAGNNNVVVMLFEQNIFKGFTKQPVADTNLSTEVLFSVEVESKEEVDLMAEKAIAGGGQCNHVPSAMEGWMYGCVFADIDGHRWNIMYMDHSKMPQ
ncbi:MAG: VOC family protein [Mucilaginibacter sp.]